MAFNDDYDSSRKVITQYNKQEPLTGNVRNLYMDLQKKMNNINVEVIRDLSKDDYQEVADSYFNNIMQARQKTKR